MLWIDQESRVCAYLRIGFLLVRRPAMAFVVAPAVVAAGRPWVRVLRRYRGRAAVRDLRLVGLVGTLVRLDRSRSLVHALLRSAAVTGAATPGAATPADAATDAAGVMHRRRPLPRTSSSSRHLTSPHHHLPLPRSLHPNLAWCATRDRIRGLGVPRLCRAALFARVHPHYTLRTYTPWVLSSLNIPGRVSPSPTRICIINALIALTRVSSLSTLELATMCRIRIEPNCRLPFTLAFSAYASLVLMHRDTDQTWRTIWILSQLPKVNCRLSSLPTSRVYLRVEVSFLHYLLEPL